MNLAKICGIAGLVVITVVLLDSCKSDPNSPGLEYMPDMYRSPSYETYGENELYGDGMGARLPVKNTISRGQDHLPYKYPNTFEGYMASDSLKNPLTASEANIAEGKVLYQRFCSHCHGKKGQGDGAVINNSDYPPPPAYDKQLKNLSEGKMFHSITYGKNLMGSHASQVTKTERWKIILYVQTLQNPGAKKDELKADNTSANNVEAKAPEVSDDSKE